MNESCYRLKLLNFLKKKEAIISTLAIHPKYRGKFLGRNLLSECFNILIEDKISKVNIHTWSTNKDALNLYKKKGFIIEKIKKEDRGKDIDTIFLSEVLEGIKIYRKE